MQLNGVIIEDTFAEAFRMWAARLVVTAIDERWVRTAAAEACGYGTSVIGCDAEAAVERLLTPDETPDGRPGAALLFFAFNAEGLKKALPNRTGQCLMTCPTTAVYDGMPDAGRTENADTARIDLGKKLRFFGDGHQKSKVVEGEGRHEGTKGQREEGTKGRRDEVTKGERHEGTEARRHEGDQTSAALNPTPDTRHPTPANANPTPHTLDPKPCTPTRLWRIPVMDGEFTCVESVGAMKAIGGGNILVCGRDQRSTLDATMAAVDAIAPMPQVITPFPGGIVRSGSKVGSRYKGMFASSNDAFCPTLRGKVATQLRDGVNCVYEIVINGLSQQAIALATRCAIEAACKHPILAISAGNYGGKLGKFHFKLREVVA